ncbi:MAG: hypothetical protein FWE84_06325 [Firmicutes bacterium]|nr:hypothetical protein [Bacillota bacterium]
MSKKFSSLLHNALSCARGLFLIVLIFALGISSFNLGLPIARAANGSGIRYVVESSRG